MNGDALVRRSAWGRQIEMLWTEMGGGTNGWYEYAKDGWKWGIVGGETRSSSVIVAERAVPPSNGWILQKQAWTLIYGKEMSDEALKELQQSLSVLGGAARSSLQKPH